MGQEPKIILILTVAALLFMLSTLFIVLILIIKVRRKFEEKRKEKCWPLIKENLALIAVQLVAEESDQQDYIRSLQVLLLIKNKSDKMAQWVLEAIMKQKANLSGEASRAMLKVYEDLDLKLHSLKKLSSWKWHIKAQGIQELEHMEQRESLPEFHRFLNAKHPDLRMTARRGITALAPNPLEFLAHLDENLSEWEQMAIYHRLRNKSKEQLPDFSKYFYHKRQSVVSFCMDMTVRFNYFELIPQLIELLKKTPRRVPVVEALTKLEAFQALPLIRKLIQKTKNPLEIVACLKFLGHIDDQSCRPLVLSFLDHELIDVRMEAVHTAIQLELELESLTDELQNMISHYKSELIS